MRFTRTVNRALARLDLHPAGDSPFPRPLRPMLATLGRAPFDNPAWVYEPKWDGFRVIAMMRGGSVQLLSRNLHSFTKLVPTDHRGAQRLSHFPRARRRGCVFGQARSS